MKKLSLLFVLVLAFVMLFAFSASAKNITKEADFSMANGGSLCQKDYVVDDNYHTAASNGKAQSYVDYYFTYETGRTISRIRVIYNSVGENMGVCTYEELSTYTKNIICRVKNADGKQIELQAVPGEKDVVYDAEGKVSYTYIDFVPEEGTSWTNITWINVPTVHDKNEKTCIWEIDIFDDEACTDATHEFVADYCNAALKCNACGATKEETSHPYLPANCARAKTCIVCKEVVGEPEGEHILETDDNDCSTAVHCTRCNSVAVAAKKHAPDANGACTNAGCTRVGEINVANKAVVESSGDWGAVHKEQLVDGDRNTSTHSPKSSGFSYSFSFADKVLVSKLIVVVNGTSSTLVPNVPTATNNAIYEVTIELQDENGFKIYETETYKVENDATIVEVVLPYTYYASKVVAKFTSRELWGNSFVREVEIYSTTVEKLDPAFVEIVAPQEGCFDRVNFKDYISEKFYTAKDNDGFYYVTDEDGNLILDEKGNKIFYAGVVRGGNSNGEGCELDGVAGSGYCLKYNGWTNSIQYNFNSKLLIADITIGFSAGGNPENGYTLWVGNVVDGVEVWTQVVDFTVGEENTNQYLSRTFILGEEGEGVEASMFRFYWKAGKYGSFSEKTLCEIDMTAFKNTCTWTENKVDVEGNCGYDRVAKCTCSVCGVEKTVVTALATGEHDLTVTKEATKATCVDFGYNTTKYCATCQKTFGGDRIEKPLGHDMSVAATCTTAKSCSRCDHTEGNPLGHKQATAATCIQKATCSVCNEEYGKLAAHTLDANLKCSACQKYVVNSDAEFKTALEKAQANADADTILLLNDVTSAKFTITTELTLDLGGKTLKLTNGHRGMDTKHDKCAIINGTINYIGKVSAIGVYQLGKLENVEIALTYDGKDGHRNVTGIALLNTATTRIGSLTNVDINSTDGNNEVVDFRGIETYQCSGSEYVIGSMDKVSIDVNNTAMIVFAPIGTVSNCTIKSAKTAILFRAAGDYQTELTLVNCAVEGGEIALEIWNDTSATANSKLVLRSDAATTFTSKNGVPYTVSIGGNVDNVSIQISGVQFAALANGTLYGSFEEAYAATPAGGTIELLADLELTDSLVIDKKITLDLNTYTVSAPNGVAGDGVFHVVAGGELTIKGNGTVNGICANKDGYHMAIFVNGGNVVIEGGTFTNVGENLTDDQYDLIYVKGGELVINGGTFIAQTPKWTLNLHDKTPGSIVVNGGSFYAYNPSASESEKPVANFVADNKCAVLNDKDYYDVINHVKGGEWLYDAETDKMVKTCVNCSKVVETTAVVAKINSIGYASLEAAVAVGGEITLEANIDLATAVVINNIVTINLNGKTLTVKKDTVGDGVFCVVAGGVLTINGEGTVNGVGNNNYNIAIWANGGSVVINGGTYTNVGATDENGDDHFDLIYAKNGGSVVINGGTFIAQTPKWTLNLKDGDGSTIVVNGGSFYAYNPTESTSEGPVVDFTSGKCAVKNSENYYVLGEHQYFNSCDARCEACGKITKEPTHNIIHVAAKAPTCTAMGNIEYWYCDICGAAWLDKALTLNTNLRAVKLSATGHTNTEIIPAILPTPSNNQMAMTAGVKCTECNTEIVSPKAVTVKNTPSWDIFGISATELILTNNISLDYKVKVTNGYNFEYIVFVFEGQEFVLSEYDLVDNKGRYIFNFDQTRPHKINSTISAYAYGTNTAGEYVVDKYDYSVMEYCIAIINENNAAKTTVISDLLYMGAATQKFVAESNGTTLNDDQLVTSIATKLLEAQGKGYKLTPSTFAGISAGSNPKYDDYDISNAMWQTANVLIGSSTCIEYSFTAKNVEGLTVVVEVDGVEKLELTANDLTVDSQGRYLVTVECITSIQYGSEVKATIMDGDTALGSITYSINEYLAYTCGKATGSKLDLAKAVYNFGQSAEALFNK